MDLNLDVSFDAKTLSGHVVLSVEKVNAGVNILVSYRGFLIFIVDSVILIECVVNHSDS